MAAPVAGFGGARRLSGAAPEHRRLDGPALWQATRLVGACALAFLAAAASGLPERYWALITAVVVTQPMLSDTLGAGRDRVLGTLVGAAVGFLDLLAEQHGWPSPPLFWAALAALALLIAVYPYLRLSAVTLIVVVLVPGAGAGALYARPLDRVVEILIGTLAAVVAAAVVRPRLWRRGMASVAARARQEAEVGE